MKIKRRLNKNKYKNKKGFTLIELAISIASGSIILVGLTSMIIFVSSSYKSITLKNDSLISLTTLKESFFNDLDLYHFSSISTAKMVLGNEEDENFINDTLKNLNVNKENNEHSLIYFANNNNTLDTTDDELILYYFKVNGTSSTINFEFIKRTYDYKDIYGEEEPPTEPEEPVDPTDPPIDPTEPALEEGEGEEEEVVPPIDIEEPIDITKVKYIDETIYFTNEDINIAKDSSNIKYYDESWKELSSDDSNYKYMEINITSYYLNDLNNSFTMNYLRVNESLV